MNKPNIGIFTYDFYPFLGGQGRHVYETYKRLKHNKDLNLYVFSPSQNNLKNHIVIFPKTRKSKLKDIIYSIKLNKVINTLIKTYNIDIAHLHGTIGGVFLLKKLDIPVIYTSYHTYVQQYRNLKNQRCKWILRWVLSLLEKRSYKLADKIIAISNGTKQAIIIAYKIHFQKVEVIPCGVNFGKFHKENSIKKIKNSLLFVGRLEERKGIKFLIETIPLVVNKRPDIKLSIVGKGKLLKKLKCFVRKNNLKENIKFLGFVSDENLLKRYNEAELVIVPSVFEGFGITTIEAMACGTPVIATNVDGIRDNIKNNENGILVEYGSKNELATQIIRLLNNTQLRKKIAEKGLKTVQNKFNLDEIAQKTFQIYNQFLNKDDKNEHKLYIKENFFNKL